jgi:HlyD family secretion protein
MVAGLAVVGTLTAGGTVWLLAGGEAATPAAARTVERVSSEGVTAKGTVEPVSTQSLSFALSGTVTAVTVKPGDMVVTGQVLARIDPADAQQAVADAQAALDDAEAALDAAASPSPSPSCTRSSPAASPPAPTASSVSASLSASARSASSTAQECTTSGSSGGSSGGSTQRGGTDAILSAQQDVNNDKAALARAERQLAGTVIKAPVSGRVLSVAIKAGDTARSNVISLGVVSTMVVKASFSEADAVALTVGESATITLPGRSGETVTAKITQIAETGTISDNLVTYAVILTFDQVPDGILVGQSANVTVTA